MTRVHARRSEVIATKLPTGWRLGSPQPGLFRPGGRGGQRMLVTARDAVGVLEVLGQSIELVLPAGVSGWLEPESRDASHVGYQDLIGMLSLSQRDEVNEPTAEPTDPRVTGPVFRSPTSGRYYGRSSPDKPPFVTVGAELATGSTVCLLEVMKTFNRVIYEGERARVRELLVADGADVNAGDPLVALEPI